MQPLSVSPATPVYQMHRAAEEITNDIVWQIVKDHVYFAQDQRVNFFERIFYSFKAIVCVVVGSRLMRQRVYTGGECGEHSVGVAALVTKEQIAKNGAALFVDVRRGIASNWQVELLWAYTED